jgi:RimJ/RimL family protein N-acetyltransferase
MAQPPTIETKRLLVRAFKDDDVEGLTSVFDDLEAMWDVIAIPGMPRVPRAVAEKRITDSIAGWRDHDAGFWAVVIADAELGPVSDIIGYCGFVNPSAGEAKIEFVDHAALEVGWGIHPAYQRRGLAGEAMKPVLDYAFSQRGCDKLIAITDPENYASQTLSLRLGFEFESEINAYGTLQERYVLEREAYLARV